MRKLVLDRSGIPTGEEEPFCGFNADLGESSFDDGFALMKERTSFSVAGTTCRVSVDLLAGYRYAQAFAPKDRDYIALEPMTAPTSALTSGRGLRFVAPVGDSGQCSESVSMEPNDATGSSPVRPDPKRDPGIGENICVGGQL